MLENGGRVVFASPAGSAGWYCYFVEWGEDFYVGVGYSFYCRFLVELECEFVTLNVGRSYWFVYCFSYFRFGLWMFVVVGVGVVVCSHLSVVKDVNRLSGVFDN